MILKYSLLFFFLFQGLWGFTQPKSTETLSVSLSTTLDTFDVNEYYTKSQYEVDTFFKITITNTGIHKIKIAESLTPSYEDDSFGQGDFYFKTFLDSANITVGYNRQIADIQYLYMKEESVLYKTLMPGEATNIYYNPLTINGVPNGINKVFIDAYLRFGGFNIKSNRISVITIYKQKHFNKK